MYLLCSSESIGKIALSSEHIVGGVVQRNTTITHPNTLDRQIMTRVAIYCRVSTDFDVSLKSLENQILAYIDLVQNNPDWHLQGIYSDRGISGTSIKRRTSFQRLLRHCE